MDDSDTPGHIFHDLLWVVWDRFAPRRINEKYERTLGSNPDRRFAIPKTVSAATDTPKCPVAEPRLGSPNSKESARTVKTSQGWSQNFDPQHLNRRTASAETNAEPHYEGAAVLAPLGAFAFLRKFICICDSDAHIPLHYAKFTKRVQTANAQCKDQWFDVVECKKSHGI